MRMITPRLAPALALPLLCLAALSLTPGTATARTYIVATYGADGGARDGSASQPFRSLQYAIGRMSGGDDIIVEDGTYLNGTTTGGQIYIDGKGGTAANRTVIRARNRWGAKIRSLSPFGGIQVNNSDYVTIQGFDVAPQDISGGTNVNAPGILATYSDHVLIRENYSHDWGCNGISMKFGDYVTIEDNVARDNAKRSNYNCSGISIYQPRERDQNGGYHVIIRRNVSFENEVTLDFNIGAGNSDEPTDGNGIILDDFYNTQDESDGQNRNPDGSFRSHKQRVLVENNLVFNNGGTGIKAFRTDQATIRHNTLYHNLRVLQTNANYRPGKISIEDCPGIFELSNNVIVQRNDSRAKALLYTVYNQPDFRIGYGWLGRWSNLIIGTRQLPSDASKSGAYNELQRGRGEQSYPKFKNATTSVGGFSGVGDFDQYFRLATDSPANNSGDNGKAAGNDLEKAGRPQNDVVERGCYERAEGQSSGGGGTTTASNAWVYREGTTGGFRNWSYGGTVTARDGGIKKNGSYSFKFQSNQDWGAASFQRATARPGTDFKELRFWARKWTDNPNYRARVRVRTGNGNATALQWRNFNPTNNFVQYTATRAQLGNPSQIRRIDINVPKGNTLWIDDLRLVYETTSSNLVLVDLDAGETSDEAPAPLSVYPSPTRGAFDVELDVPARLDVVEMAFRDASGRRIDGARLNVIPGRNRMHFDMTGQRLAPGVYHVHFLSEDGSFSRAERVVVVE